jgi:acylphosphatase
VPPERIRRRLLVRGRVQGVAYRASTCDAARSLGLDGWVRNLPDGRVEAVAEGPPEAVGALVDFCRRGPRLARVEEVAVTEEPVAGERGFRVAR